MKKLILILFLIPLTAFAEKGVASWYSIKSNGGTETASGEVLCNHKMTAAHKTLKIGTKVRVTNLNNGKSIIVRINDRGPYIKGRVIDLTPAAFSKISHLTKGLFRCKVEVVK